MTAGGKLLYVLASLCIAGMFAGAWWLAWAAWWPVGPAVTVHSAYAEPSHVRAGESVVMISQAEFHRSVTMAVTPRLDGPNGSLVFMPTTDQHWPAGNYTVRRVIEVPFLSPGEWRYTPLFTYDLTPLRKAHIDGLPIAFTILPP